MLEHAYLGRQPILDRQQKIVAYELLFRRHRDATTANVSDEHDASSTVLASTLCDLGAKWVLGNKLAFINVSASMLLGGGALELLPPERVVLELLETVQATPQVLARCQHLRSKGFTFALDDFELNEENRPLLQVASYIKVDIRQTPLEKIPAMLRDIEKFHPNLKLVAEKVETAGEFKACKDIGFSFFQGFYFAHPETLSAKTINPAYENVLLLLNKVRENANPPDIEKFFKHDVALTFKLLRYINSVGFGLSCEIESIRHAIAILGYQQLYRWLTLLLVTAGQATTPAALLITAMTRGRLTELLGQEYMEPRDRDNLFVVGMFSLLDVILETPMDKVLEKLSLPTSVSDALTMRQGIYGPFLSLAEACEAGNAEKIEELAGLLQLEPAKINHAHLAALAWTEAMEM
ncbi:MAG: EAL domain-containing protein [Sulfuricella sp.]|nr:EAL domain-containing protein [Sulfuricella sp.]